MAERGGLYCGGRQGIPYLAQKKQRYTWVSDDFCGAAYNFKIKTEKGGIFNFPKGKKNAAFFALFNLKKSAYTFFLML